MAFVLLPLYVAADTDAARREFNTARKFFDEGRYDTAVEGFRRAFDADPNWKLQYNIAQCEAALKRYGLAIEAFERYLAAGGDEIPETRYTEVMEEMRRLREMIGTIYVQGSRDAEVIVDGIVRGRLPLPGGVRVTAGLDHVIEVRVAGALVLQEKVFVGSGQTIQLQAASVQTAQSSDSQSAVTPVDGSSSTASIPLVAEEQSSGTKRDATDESMDHVASEDGRPLRTAGWVLAGTGATVLLTGAIIGGVALSKNRDLVDACGDDPCPDRRDEASTRDHLAVASTVLLPVGGVVAVAGMVLLAVGARREKQRSVVMTPVAAPGTVAMVAEWRF